ncbi:EFR1 family ferrodoxin [Fusibacter ferrireducens]|uniref:Ferredoxin n=1 Tax=Fusibacter ferrireducens TaxID=2785058 RepID=A0ABR9ZXG9_9FIRM|nr:EFR1 family ferrodoxin [Fusibacter ferrireducens]MBF4694560.1 EFR1 family ferrodoxin [Fusibacter ferrireducens]
MLDFKAVALYYFSGTGNTLVVAKETEAFFKQRGYSVTFTEMGTSAFQEQDHSTLIGLIFPVAIQSTFPNVWHFIESLPQSNGQSIFMIDTMEAFSGGVVGPAKKILTEKGYKCVGACEIKMATSMQTSQKKVEEGLKKQALVIPKLNSFLEKLIQGETKWRRVPLLSDWMRMISKNRKIWTSMSEKIEVNHEECVQCSSCIKHCPMHVISYVDSKISIDHHNCIACMRCVNYCPKNAFMLNQKHLIQKKTVKLDALKPQKE